jgi:hypothetical protein
MPAVTKQPTETGDLPSPNKTLPPVPCYEWLKEEARAKIEAFNRKREDVLKTRADALESIARCRATVNDGSFSPMTLKAVEKARAELAVADAEELHLALKWTAMFDLIQADNNAQIDAAKRAIDDRENEIKAAGAKAGKHFRVIEAEIETDAKIQAICDSCPTRLDPHRMGETLNGRAEVLSAKLDKLFTF